MSAQLKDQAISIAVLNRLHRDQFVDLLGDIVERSPWVAERAFAKQPFLSVEDLHLKLMNCIHESSHDEKRALFNRHPELAGSEAIAGEMTGHSTDEQGRLGLNRLPARQFEHLSRLNRDYRAKFGFPFIAAMRLHQNLDSVMSQFEARMQNDIETEIDQTLRQISEIVWGRLGRLFQADP